MAWFDKATQQLDRMLTWLGGLGVMWGVLTWLAGRMQFLSQSNWADRVAIGLAAALIVMLSVTASLALWRVFFGGRPGKIQSPPENQAAQCDLADSQAEARIAALESKLAELTEREKQRMIARERLSEIERIPELIEKHIPRLEVAGADVQQAFQSIMADTDRCKDLGLGSARKQPRLNLEMKLGSWAIVLKDIAMWWSPVGLTKDIVLDTSAYSKDPLKPASGEPSDLSAEYQGWYRKFAAQRDNFQTIIDGVNAKLQQEKRELRSVIEN